MFKVPIVPPPKTPDVVLLEEFPSRGTGRKSCSTLLSSSGDMTGLYTSGVDLFDKNMDDHRSPGKYFTECKQSARVLQQYLNNPWKIDLTPLSICQRSIYDYRSFSRDVIPFPVGHIGVPLSIA